MDSRRISRGLELIKKMAKTKVIATDLDGTLTIDRNSYFIPPEVIRGIKLLDQNDIKVVLVTANGFPITLGIARYLGIHAVVAENGCTLSFTEPVKIEDMVFLCDESYRWVAKEIVARMQGRVLESWQNEFRKCDFALVTRDKKTPHAQYMEDIKIILEELGLKDKLRVSSSGYAIHITPSYCTKLNGLKLFLEKVGASLEETIGIGDSVIDVEFVSECGISVAVSNADEELKKIADIITDEPSGLGFYELAKTIVDSKNLAENSSLPPQH